MGRLEGRWQFSNSPIFQSIFGAIQAVNDVSFSLEAGEAVGLMGDNGAGKSTLVKMIAGNFRPSYGTMRLDGQDLRLHRPVEARQRGIEIGHCRTALCNNPTAAANRCSFGRELRRGFRPLRIRLMSMHSAPVRFKGAENRDAPAILVKQMSGGQRQAVAIARTMLAGG